MRRLSSCISNAHLQFSARGRGEQFIAQSSFRRSKMRGLTLRSFCVGLLCVFFVFGSVQFVHAQSTTGGAIGGTVYDPVGAAVPSAKVTVHNNATNAEQTVTTDDSGYYRVTSLQPASYTVTIDASGFAAFKAEQIIVQVGTITELSPHLTVAKPPKP